jgi:transposase
VPEVRRLLHALSEPPARRPFHLHWSRWRRTHQFRAWRGHVARRATAAQDWPTPRLALDPGLPPPPATASQDPAIGELTDTQWARARALLPKPNSRGRPRSDQRAILAAVLWVTRAGASWRALPERFGPWPTVYTHYRRWCRADLWPRLVEALQQTPADDATAGDQEVSL